MHWGLVNGRSQTHLRWGARPGQPEPGTWQHDLFHGDHTPYARAEIDLFKKTIATSRKKRRRNRQAMKRFEADGTVAAWNAPPPISMSPA